MWDLKKTVQAETVQSDLNNQWEKLHVVQGLSKLLSNVKTLIVS